MKEKALKAMIKAVDGMKSMKSDFYTWDLRAIASADESVPFLWVCSETATHLLILDEKKMIDRAYNNEAWRFGFMANPTQELSYFAQAVSYGGDVYYYDGMQDELQPISKEILTTLLANTFRPICKRVEATIKDAWGEIDGSYTAKLPIHFTQGARKLIREILATDEADELLQTLYRIRKWKRIARQQKIDVGIDFVNKSFSFNDVANDHSIMNGGIIYDGGHWTIHT